MNGEGRKYTGRNRGARLAPQIDLSRRRGFWKEAGRGWVDIRDESWVESPYIPSRGNSRCRDGRMGERRAPVGLF